MYKSALRVVVSLLLVAAAMPAAHAESKSKKHAQKKHVKHAVVSSKPAPRNRVRHKASYQRVGYTQPNSNVSHAMIAPAPVMTAGDMAGLHHTRDPLALGSNAALVIDQNTSQVLFEKNPDVALPIASVTKLMTATIVVETHQDMNEILEVTADDVDREKNSSSRLRVGSRMSRANMLHIALMSSENRAASALGRNFPGGLPAFVAAMNAKAKSLGMNDTHYVDSTGLSSQNMASARDLAKLVAAAYRHPIIRQYSTDDQYTVNTGSYNLPYRTSNRLVMNSRWDIGLQKTGYIAEAGHCLVMQARIDNRPVVMVFLDSKGKYTRLADADRVRKWLERARPQVVAQAPSPQS